MCVEWFICVFSVKVYRINWWKGGGGVGMYCMLLLKIG